MQTVTHAQAVGISNPAFTAPHDNPTVKAYANYQIIRRNGAVVPFEPNKIAVAMMKAFLAVHGTQGAASASVRETVDQLTQSVIRALLRSRPGGGTFHIEDVQDHVELGLMRGGHHEIARAYVLYREKRSQERARQSVQAAPAQPALYVTDRGQRVALDLEGLHRLIQDSCAGLSADVKPEPIVAETKRNLYDGVPIDEVYKAAIMAARTLIEKDPDYTYVTSRLLMHTIRREILGEEVKQEEMATRYPEYFPQFIAKGVKHELLDERLQQFDLARLGAALKPERDLQFDYLGLQTLYDRYFLHVRKARIELPQAFFMRVAMGLSLNEIDREARAIEFYELLSSFDFMSSTPTLFNSGTLRSQLSSCYLTTVPDDLDGIYESIKENALLSKFAGGLGNDWTRVRALGSHIKGTNGESQGVVPFLKVVNDTAVAVNQGGKRKGAVCTYLETWHLDIEEFLELRKNTGDDRRRTHDMNTANWIPDLFMRRVMEKAPGPCFRPRTAPTCTTCMAKLSRKPMWPMKPRPSVARSSPAARFRRWTCGARCCPCCSKPAILGLPSRTPAMCARPSSTSAWCTRRTFAPRSRSTPATARLPCATSARSTWCATSKTARSITASSRKPSPRPCGCSTT